MKALLAAFIFSIVTVSAFAQDNGHASRMLDVFGESMTKNTLKRVEEMFTESATVYWVDKKVYGRPAILKYLRSQVPADKFHLSFNPDDGIEDSNISSAWGTFGILYGSGEGQVSNQIVGRYTVVARKTGDDVWQVVSLHLSIARTSGSEGADIIKS